MSFVKVIVVLFGHLFFLATSIAYECTEDTTGEPIFEHDGHCLSSRREAWLTTPTYLLQAVPWQVGDKPIVTDDLYSVLVNGIESWGTFSYQEFTNPPAHYLLAIFGIGTGGNEYLPVTVGDGIPTISFVHDVESICNSPFGCERALQSTRRFTTAFGGIFIRDDSDIYISSGGWSLPPFTVPCSGFDTITPDLRGVVNHEIGHGLGTAHQVAGDGEPRPVMAPAGCQVLPVIKEMGDVDHLYSLIGGVTNAEIRSPETDEEFDWFAFVTLVGFATNNDGVDISDQLMWMSSIQGLLGTGASVETDALVPGEHVISLIVPGPGDSDSGRGADLPRDLGVHLGYKAFFKPQAGASLGVPATLPKNAGSDIFPSSIIVNVLGPVVTEFVASNNPCFIEIGGDDCQTTLSWNVETNDFPGGILIKDVEGTIIASDVTGTQAVDLIPGDNLFDLFYRDDNNEDHLLSTLDVFAGEISGVIVGPGQCEIDPPPDDHCPMDIELAGFADHVILYDMGRDISLFELDANGLFTTTINLEVPIDGIQLGLFSDDVTEGNRLAEKSISTFRMADQYEDDDFVSGFQSLTEIDDKLQTLFLNQRQLDHNFHKAEDVDFVRVPFPTNLGLSSIRTRNLTPGLATTIDIGCVRYRSGTHRYESLDGGNSLRVEEGPEPGSAIATWTTGLHPSGCLGESYFAKIDWLEFGPDPAPTYDVLFVNGREDPYEPDDNREDAREIRLNEIQTRDFNVDKVDWLMFSPLSNGEYELSLSSGSSFLNPCIRIERNLLPLVETCFENLAFVPISFTTGAPVLIRITNNTARAGTVYDVEVVASQPGPDIYEDDDNPRGVRAFYACDGTNTQYRNFFDDGVDRFIIQCYCPESCLLSEGPLELRNLSAGSCIELMDGSELEDYGARLCGNSVPGPNTDYAVEKYCECGPPDPSCGPTRPGGNPPCSGL